MKNQDWGGNLRELRNVIRRSVLFAQDNVIRINNLPEFPKHIKNQKNEIVEMDRSERPLSKYNEKEQILEALKEARGNKTVAAKILQIDRKTLYNKIHHYNIEL